MKEMNQNCCACSIRNKNKFTGSKDFYDFVDYISKNDSFREITPKYEIYSRFWHEKGQDHGISLGEKWYECSSCKKIWRLVTPDPPFAGIWDMVDEEENSNNKEKN